MKDKKRPASQPHQRRRQHHSLHHQLQQHQQHRSSQHSHRSLAASLSCFNKAGSSSGSCDSDEDVARFTGMQDEDATAPGSPCDSTRVGCMSLRRDKRSSLMTGAAAAGAATDPNRLDDGWCYALSPDEHQIRLVDRQQQQQQQQRASGCYGDTTATPTPTELMTAPNGDPCGRAEQRSFTLDRSGTSGYGFTLVGSQPVRVGKVEADSSAGRAGIRSGDIVVSVNGETVLSYTCDRVVHAIRLCPFRLDIGVQRWLEAPLDDCRGELPQTPLLSLQHQQQLSAPQPPASPAPHQPLTKPQTPTPPQLQQLVAAEFGSLSIRRRVQHRPQRSAVSQVASLTAGGGGGGGGGGSCRSQLLEVRGFASPTPTAVGACATLGRARSAVVLEELRQRPQQQFLQQYHMQLQQRLLSPQPQPYRRIQQQQLQQPQSTISDPAECCQRLSRQRAISQLVMREESFARTLTACRRHYQRRLARRLTDAELRTLFFNQDALLAASRTALQQIRSSGSAEVENIGQIYRARLFQLCDDYREYAENLAEAGLPLLDRLRATAPSLVADATCLPAGLDQDDQEDDEEDEDEEDEEDDELRPPPPPPPLRTCLLRPVSHLSGLVRDFNAILASTPAAHYDHLFVEDVQQNLEHCASLMPQMPPELPPPNPLMMSSMTSGSAKSALGASNLPPQSPAAHQRHPTTSPTAHSLVASSSGVSSEQSGVAAGALEHQQHHVHLHHQHQHSQSDMLAGTVASNDLVALQQRLIFPGHVRPFHLPAPGRRLALSGELLWHPTPQQQQQQIMLQSRRIHAVLLTDLLLLTQRRPGDAGLLALAEPCRLAGCSQAAFDYPGRLFQLAFRSSLTSSSAAGGAAAASGTLTRASTVGGRLVLLLEAPSCEAKQLWRLCVTQLLLGGIAA